MSLFGSATVTSTTAGDIEISDPPSDSISALAFSPQTDHLAVASWDNNVRIYEVGVNGQTQGKAMFSHEGPVLSTCWNKDGSRVFSSGLDNAARMFELQTGQTTQVGAHDAPVRQVKWVETPQGGILATGSWDKTIKYWDLRAPAAISTVQLPERCYSFDVEYPWLVAGTAERHIQVFNLANPTTPYKNLVSPLKMQTRVVTCFSNGFAVGSVEGRVAIHYVEEKDAPNNFSFRCHRKDSSPTTKDQSIVYAVNDIHFHPVHGTFSTCGSDGTVGFWDKDTRVRLKSFDPAPGPISTTAFNSTGTMLAYAVSYDWSKGHAGMTNGHANKVMLHVCKDEEVKKRQRR